MSKRIVAHLDMDAFFASVEEANTPNFLGKPIVVGSEIINGVGRGVVSTANYRARAYGIHSAMPISIAWRLSQEAKKQGKEEVIFLPVDFNLYHKVSAHVHDIIKNYSALIEQASVDEFYFSAQGADALGRPALGAGPASGWDYAVKICQKIKADIKKSERITCSIGIAPNKLISKIAAGINKPDGMLMVQEDEVQEFLNPLPIRELPGIGPKTAEIFYKQDIKIIQQLLSFSREQLRELLGKHGEKLYDKIRGIDESPISEFHEVKSIGEQTTLAHNTLEPVLIFDVFFKLSNSVFQSFLKSGFTKFNTITITIRFGDFETKTSSKSFKEGIGVNDKKKFDLEILRLVLPFLDARSNPKRKPIRLIGVRVEKMV